MTADERAERATERDARGASARVGAGPAEERREKALKQRLAAEMYRKERRETTGTAKREPADE